MYLNNTLWLIAERIIRLVILLLVGVYLARYLGPETFGRLSYLISFVGLFGAVSTLGLDGLVVQLLVRQPDRANDVIGTAFFLKLLGATVVLLAVIISANVFDNSRDAIILMMIISSAFFFDAFNVIDLFFQSKVKSVYPAIARLVQAFFAASLKIYMIYIQADMSVFVILIVVDALLLALVYVAAYRICSLSLTDWRWNGTIARSLLHQSRFLIFADIIISIYVKIDKVMLKEMLDERAVGLYTSATALSEAWYFVPMAICSSVYPMLIAAKEQGEDVFQLKLQQLYNLMVWVALAIAIPVSLLGKQIIELIYGEAFISAGQVLTIHIWSGVFVFLGVASGKWLLIESRFRVISTRALAGLTSNVALNYLFIPSYGIVGAAYATLISQSINALWYDLVERDCRQTFWIKIKALLLLDRSVFKFGKQ